MDFRQIEAYVKVIEMGSFSKAAEVIYLSQPSVSTYINALEKELDTVLINRSTKELSPTFAGKIFYENAKEILTLKNNTVERIKNLSGNLNGELSVLASSVPALYILPGILSNFDQIYPEISFDVKQADTAQVFLGIGAQKAEIGFAGGIIDDGKCEFKEFMTERMVFIAPYDKELFENREFSLDELLYEKRFISREKGSGTRARYEEFFTNNNIDIGKINICAQFDNTQSVINAVSHGLGITIASEYAAQAFIDRKLVIPLNINIPLPERTFYYVLKKNIFHSHLVNLFVEFLNINYNNTNLTLKELNAHSH
ncbi:MAG: LysR family transcriptional regulator [Clostridiales bacterium]|jgi:DNA-binding transcriptional LysR family regulator|nr:LysR family transcriptional regulator [Clostridiales bacterium]